MAILRNKILLLVLAGLLLFVFEAAAQQKPKSKPKSEKPPSKEGMGEMLKEMEKEMEKEMSNRDPEEKKTLDSLGFKMPDFKNMKKTVSGMSQADVNQYHEESQLVVPAKDAARIAMIPKLVVTDATMPSYMQDLMGGIEDVYGSNKVSLCQTILDWAKMKYQDPSALGSSAAGLLAMGKVEPALFIMGRAVMADPKDVNLVNNFGVMVSMAGGEQLSIPLLNYANSKVPDHPTILNNLGQAWYGLGDLKNAENFLNKALAIYPMHAQANLTKSYIEFAKGNTQAAVEAAKHSIREEYSPDADRWLEDLDYDITIDDIGWDFPMEADNLGLAGFISPDYPYNIDDCPRLAVTWETFREKISIEIDKLYEEEKVLQAKVEQMLPQRVQEGVFPPTMPKAHLRLRRTVAYNENPLLSELERLNERVGQMDKRKEEYEERIHEKWVSLNKKYKDLFGEGKPNPAEEACMNYNLLLSEQLAEVNGLYKTLHGDYVRFMIKKLNDETYYDKYTKWPEQYELSVVRAKLTWLGLLNSQQVLFLTRSIYCTDEIIKSKDSGTLKNFDDVACKYKSEAKFIFGKITSQCSILKAELDISLPKEFKLEALKGSIETRMADKDNTPWLDEVTKFSMEMGMKKGIGFGSGPVRVDGKAGGAVYVNYERGKPVDYGLKLSADVKVGTNIVKNQQGTAKPPSMWGDKVIENIKAGKGYDGSSGPLKDASFTVIGVEAQVSLVQGAPTATGKGILSGLSIGQK